MGTKRDFETVTNNADASVTVATVRELPDPARGTKGGIVSYEVYVRLPGDLAAAYRI